MVFRSGTFDDVDLYVAQMAASASPSPLYQLKKLVDLFGSGVDK